MPLATCEAAARAGRAARKTGPSRIARHSIHNRRDRKRPAAGFSAGRRATALPRDKSAPNGYLGAAMIPFATTDRSPEPVWAMRTLAALAVILAIRLLALQLTGLELAYDEAQYWAWSRDFAFGYYTKPGMIAWLIGATTAVCGDGTACVRFSAPVLHIATAGVIHLLAARLYDGRTAFLAALGWALIPGVAISSLLITTDVPLLFFWTVGLLATVLLHDRPGPGPALLLGGAVALGINAKYAMIYLPAVTILWAAATPSARWLLRSRWFWAGTLIGLAGFLPNLAWNVQNDFVTFRHTGDNTGWDSLRLSVKRPLEYLAGQFALPGPILLGAVVVMLARGARTDKPATDRFLLWHSVPVILVIGINSAIAKMHGNWAATAYPAVVVLATAWLARTSHGWLKASLALSLTTSLFVAVGSAFVGHVDLRAVTGQINRLLHWQELSDAVAARAAGEGVGTVVTVGRPLTSQMIYGLRDRGVAVRAYLAPGATPADHFEMTVPWSPGDGGPVLLLTTDTPEELGIPAGSYRRLADLPSRVFLTRDGAMPVYRIDR